MNVKKRGLVPCEKAGYEPLSFIYYTVTP